MPFFGILCHFVTHFIAIKNNNMGIYGTVLTGQIDINVLESSFLKQFSQKIEKTESVIFPLYLPYNLAELQCKICPAK